MSHQKPVACANCTWAGTEDQCPELADASERVAPGEIMPAGECPECGAVAHFTDIEAPKQPSPALLEAIADLEKHVGNCPDNEPDPDDYDDMESASSAGLAAGRFEALHPIKPILARLKGIACSPASY